MTSKFYAKELFPNETEEERNERVSNGAKYGHLKRQLHSKEPLTGKTLELALELVTPSPEAEESSLKKQLNGITKKLNAGLVLSDYETHLIVDVLLVHERLQE